MEGVFGFLIGLGCGLALLVSALNGSFTKSEIKVSMYENGYGSGQVEKLILSLEK